MSRYGRRHTDITEEPKSKVARFESEHEESNVGRRGRRGLDQVDAADSVNVVYKEAKAKLEELFLVKQPKDLFHFWNFCKGKKPSAPLEALKDATGLTLVGPFVFLAAWEQAHNEEIVAKKPAEVSKEEEKIEDDGEKEIEEKKEVVTGKRIDVKAFYDAEQKALLRHGRFFYDVPEFQTVIADLKTDLHIGYFRDDPDHVPAFVASNDNQGPKLSVLGDNLFGALFNLLAERLKNVESPFQQSALQKLKESVHVYCTMNIAAEDFSLDKSTRDIKTRWKQSVANPFHGAGMVVPYDKAAQTGYRAIPETTANLKRILSKAIVNKEDEQALKAVQELVTNVQYANDEGDPGMGLELGLDLFLSFEKDLDYGVEGEEKETTGNSATKKTDEFKSAQGGIDDKKEQVEGDRKPKQAGDSGEKTTEDAKESGASENKPKVTKSEESTGKEGTIDSGEKKDKEEETKNVEKEEEKGNEKEEKIMEDKNGASKEAVDENVVEKDEKVEERKNEKDVKMEQDCKEEIEKSPVVPKDQDQSHSSSPKKNGHAMRLVGMTKHLLNVAYEILDREAFAKIASAHLERRQCRGASTIA